MEDTTSKGDAPAPQRGWKGTVASFFRGPAFSAAVGAFVAFGATQAALYFQARNATDDKLMLDELNDVRAVLKEIKDPTTSNEAAAVVGRLQKDLRAFSTEQARRIVLDNIAFYDSARAAMSKAELDAQKAKEEAERASAALAAEADNVRLQAKAAAAKKVAAEKQNALQKAIDRSRRWMPPGTF